MPTRLQKAAYRLAFDAVEECLSRKTRPRMDSTGIKRGDRVRTIYGSVETAVSVILPMVYAATPHANVPGGGHHHTKVFKIAKAAADPQRRSGYGGRSGS